jgi:4-hydroxy-2-oxoheptanedioate aldolase
MGRDLAPPLSERVHAGDRLTGLVVKMPAASTIEIAGHCGFDLVLIDTEHGTGDTEMLENHLRAAEAVGVPALVRVGAADGTEILRALDAGAEGIVVPHVSDLATADRVVRFAHYPPRGGRGLATSTRAGRYGLTDPREHVRAAGERTLVIVQIEDAEAVPCAAAIASQDGIDGVLVGPTDLSTALGHPGEYEHPDVVAAIECIVADVLEAENSALCMSVGDEHGARTWHGRGAAMVLIPAPPLITREFRRLLAAVRDPRQSELPR